jgi:hypothetical protein
MFDDNINIALHVVSSKGKSRLKVDGGWDLGVFWVLPKAV